MKWMLVLLSLIVTGSAYAVEVMDVDCLNGDIEEQGAELNNDQLDELSKKCHKEAAELFERAGKDQDKAILIQSSTARKSATIAKKMRENRVKSEDMKKEKVLRKVQRGN